MPLTIGSISARLTWIPGTGNQTTNMNVRMRNRSRLRLLCAAFLFLWFEMGVMQAAKLNPTGWGMVNPALTDNNVATCITNMQVAIDFGATNTIDRVYMTGTNRSLQYWPNSQSATNPPLGLITVSVGNTYPPTNQVGTFIVPYDAGNPVDTEVDVRFSPAACRYVLIQLQTNVTWGVNCWPGYALASQPQEPPNLNWRISELEIYGFSGTFTNKDAVVESTNSTSNVGPLNLAASDLSYYLGELEGYPVPIINANQTNSYPGRIYNILDLKPLAPDYNTMMANIGSGALPTNVNVEVSGREIVFTGWPYRDVLWGVWQFLEDQGVGWVYPDAMGDNVPTGAGVSLSMLPLNFTPSAKSIYANFDTSALEPWPYWELQSVRQSYLYPWRNHWTCSQVGYGPLGGSEIPAAPAPGNLNTNYTEEFVGYPHNFNSVFPTRILEQNPNWWGYDPVNGWVNPTNSEVITPSLNNPGLINWVVNKMVAVDTAYPIPSQHPLNLAHFNNAYNLLPMDATVWSQDTNWDVPANGPVLPVGNAWVNAGVTQSFSGMYYAFATNVAIQAFQQDPNIVVGTLAYAAVYEPPVNIASFPNNVQVEVCMYGAPALPISSPINAAIKSDWDTWHSKASRLCCYDYTLLHTDYWQTNEQLETPLVAAIVDRANYLNSLGALNGGCQATITSIPHNPWNFYAYPRIRWDISKTAQNIESNFFYDYFGESGAAMLAYYQTLENNVISNNINSHLHGYCYTIAPGEFSLSVLYKMQTCLTLAESQATNWLTVERISTVSNDFAWLLSQENLAGVNLNDATPYQQIGNSQVTLVLSNLTALNTIAGSSGTPWANNPIFHPSSVYWEMENPSSIQETLNLLQSGIYTVTISASRSIYSQSPSEVLSIALGSSTTNLIVTSTNYSTFTVNLNSNAGGEVLFLDDWHSPAFGFTVDINQIQVAEASASNPAVQVTPESLSLGTVLSGTSATNSFTVQNVGGGTLSGTASVGSPFTIVSGGTYNLTANQSQTITVSFNPTTAGSYSQNVTLTGGGGATVGVSGSATNAPVPTPVLQVTPGSVAYGTILNGTSKTNSFTVQNVGTGTLTGTASAGAPFSVVSGGSYSLGANASQPVTVVFSPTAASNYNQSVTFTGGNGASTTVTGSATNAPVPTPVLQVTPGSIAYGTILNGTSETNSFTVQNIGTGTLIGTAIVGAPFSIVSGGSYSLGASASQTVTVAFSPIVASNYNQSVTFTGGNGTNTTVAGSATNAPVNPAIKVTPGSVAYGTLLVGTSKTNSFTVQNVGGGTLSGTASVWVPFSILSGGSYSLGSNQSQTVTVVFSPNVASNYNQSVTFTGGNGTNTTVTGSATNAPPILPTVSAINVNAADVDLSLPGLQIYAGTTVQFSATATNAQTWQWSYAVNGGTLVVWTNGTSPITNISCYFGTNTISNSYVWTLVVSNSQGWAESQTNLEVEAQPLGTTNTGLIFTATNGVLSGMLMGNTVINGVPSSYIYLPPPAPGYISSGTAVFSFTVANAGNYEIQALVDAPNTSANSFAVNIDSVPQDPAMIWDILPITSGFEQRIVSWRGSGTANSDQFVPKVFGLSAGAHQICFKGEEPGTALASFALLQVIPSPPPPPTTPDGLRIVSP
jgi:hypothetical protein